VQLPLGASATEPLERSAVEPSDLSEPSGLAPSVSIKQTTAPTATASPSSAFNVIIPLASAGNLELLYQSQPQQLVFLYIISVFTNQVAISTVIDSW
jgi:hypothetical protein